MRVRLLFLLAPLALIAACGDDRPVVVNTPPAQQPSTVVVPTPAPNPPGSVVVVPQR